MKKIFLTMLMLVAATAIMSAQDEIEQTEAPVIYYENNDQGGFATITIYDEDPEAQIYWCYRFDYDGVFSDWMVYSDPVNFTEPGTYTVRAYAISPGKEASNMSELYFTVTENPVIVWGAYVYADGVDEENGLQVHICSDPSYGYDFMYGEMVLDGFKYQINHSGEWLQYDINASTIYLPEYGDYEIDAYGYADGHGSSPTATAWIHYDADGYTSYSQPRDDYYQYYVHNDVAYYIMNDSTVCVSGREIPKTSPSFELPHPAKGDIVIPATFNWNEKTYTVTGIGNNAFNPSLLGESEMTSISIPNTVTSIGEGAFANCSLLTSIVIPDAVTVINNGTFSSCSGLTSISIPDAVTAIGMGAFSGCSSLTSITIPNAVTAIGESAFINCGSLTSIVVESGNTIYDSRDNCNAIIETASNTLIAGCMNTLIPNSATAIGERAFYGCTGLINLTIPNSVTAIGERAFYGCTGLTNLTIPNSVTAIGDFAFNDCNSLAKVSFGEAVTLIGKLVFYNCSSLTSIISHSTTPATVSANSFIGYSCDIYTQATLFVPNESLEAYQTHEVWGQFARIVPFIGAGPGDVNGDGSVSVSDVTGLIDMLLSSDDLPAWVDVNGDGTVSIIDVTTLIDMLLTGNF